MKIYLKSKNKPIFYDSISVVEKVDSLINFRNVSSNDRWTFCQSPTGSLRHPDECITWCMPEMRDSLKSAIDMFYNWSIKVYGSPIILSLNDLSLMIGGRYDIDALWDRSKYPDKPKQRHYYHRTGKSVDINEQTNRKYMIKIDTLIIKNSDTTKWKWTDTVGNKIKEILGNSLLYPKIEREIHFELEK